MTQGLTALALLPENPCSIPSADKAAHRHLYNSSPRTLDTLFWFPWAPGTHVVHTQANHSYVQKKIK